jgi:REP element-mobilizing transposase RayT
MARTNSVADTLKVTKRNLPHWELSGSTYFVTYRCNRGLVLSTECRDIVLANWLHWKEKRYLLHTLVVMPDHIHTLFTPLPNSPSSWHALEEILHTNKSFAAHEINRVLNRRGAVWQDERYDRIVRDEEEFWEKWNYIAENPSRHELVADPLKYPWLYLDPLARDRSAS